MVILRMSATNFQRIFHELGSYILSLLPICNDIKFIKLNCISTKGKRAFTKKAFLTEYLAQKK